MKFAVKGIAALVAGGLVMGALAATPAVAGDKKCDITKRIDADLRKLDKELFGWLHKGHKR